MRGWRGCSAGPPGRQGQLTHLQPGLSSGGGGGGGGGGIVGSAAPEPQAGRCWLPPQPLAPSRDPVAAAAGSRLRGHRRARSLSPPHAPTSTPSRGPGTAAWLHPGLRRGGGAPRRRAWGEKCAEVTPECSEQAAGSRLGSAAWAPAPPPTPHRSPLPSVRCAALGVGGWASGLWVPLTVRPLCARAVTASSEVRKRACVWRYCLRRVSEKWQLPKRGSSLLGCCGQAGLAYLRR